MNPTGDVIAAGEAGGAMYMSRDGGATWTAGNSPSATWISSAMSASGSVVYALEYGGAMYVSRDFGSSWTRLAAAPGNAGWEAVTTSQDGQRVAAVVQNGALMLSSNGGATWRTAAMPDGQPTHWWRWIDGSADGRVLVAVAHTGDIFRSADAGATWQRLDAGAAENWYRVKVSADGSTIAVVANAFGGVSGTGIYVSRDGGANWTKGYSLVADYTFLAMSADGRTIAATYSNAGSAPGGAVRSTNGGTSFTRLGMPTGDSDWRAIAMSAGGDRVAAAAGGFNTQTSGRLYTGR
ncbi:WD40/YVTN/BNR-like repeat-containing protein [Ramlibacter sp. PS4R-6]|uniref:WD40/YVTN/BNR-like repeat-containing protein n=1 Tax=Ramlibacter sp. PS4R-6 TaxID=3133438 RepID=UPI0030B046B7